MPQLSYFEVTGTWEPSYPKGVINGVVTFRMLIENNGVLAAPTLDNPAVVVPTVVRTVIDNNTLRPVPLLANTAPLNLVGTLYYTAEFSNVSYSEPGQLQAGVTIPPITFAASTDTTAVNLVNVTPAAGVVAAQLASILSTGISDATTLGRQLLTAPDAATALSDLGIGGLSIPITQAQLASAVQTNLNLAASALQSIAPGTDISVSGNTVSLSSAAQTVLGLASSALQPSAVVNNADGTLSVTGVNSLEPLSTVTILTASTAPAIGQTTYYNATSGNLTPTLPALSGLRVGARLAVRRDPADVSANTVTLTCAGADTFYSSGATSTTLPLSGEQREYQVVSQSGTKYWSPAGSLNPVAALDQRYASNVAPVTPKTANYTAAAGDMVPCNAGSGPFTVTLPTAPADKTNVVLKKTDSTANAVTFACGGSNVFDVVGGSTSGTLTLPNQAVRLQYYAASGIWYVLSTDEPLSQLDARYGSTVVEYTTTQTGVSVPANVSGVWVERLISPGGGGASGRRGAAGTVRCGGGSGGSGAVVESYYVQSALLGSTFTVTLPAGGAGGAAVTTDDTNGNPGGAPAVASFASGSFLLSTFAGTAAAGGTNAAGGGGVGGSGQRSGSTGGSASVTGGVGGGGATVTNGGPSSGGAGGGITSANAASNGGAGGAQTLQYGGTQPAGGIVGGASPSGGSALTDGVGGLGAGGGAASITGAAQAGATALGYGAGGGGGGASLDGNNSGAGGNGGPAYCRLRWVSAFAGPSNPNPPNTGQELAYAETFTAFTTTNTSTTDIALNAATIPGLSVTVIGTGRPVVVEFVAPGAYNTTTANAEVAAALLINGTQNGGVIARASSPETSGFTALRTITFRRRIVLTNGVPYTFTVGVSAESGTGQLYANNATGIWIPMSLTVVGQ